MLTVVQHKLVLKMILCYLPHNNLRVKTYNYTILLSWFANTMMVQSMKVRCLMDNVMDLELLSMQTELRSILVFGNLTVGTEKEPKSIVIAPATRAAGRMTFGMALVYAFSPTARCMKGTGSLACAKVLAAWSGRLAKHMLEAGSTIFSTEKGWCTFQQEKRRMACGKKGSIFAGSITSN